MAVDILLKLDDVKGESVVKKHEGWIDVLSWSWGMTQSGSTHTATGGGSGKVNVQDLSFTKHIDMSTHNLIKMCCSGKHFKEATLKLRKAGGDAVEYLKVTLKDIIISSVSTGGSGGDDRITESVTLNFGSFKVEYTPQVAAGTGGGGCVASWNIATNSET